MIHVLLNVFDAIADLPRACQSTARVFHSHDVEFVMIDGAYPDWPSDHRSSIDGTQDYALQVGHLIHAPDTPEVEKRNLGLHYIDCQASDGDWVLYLDADEELTQLFGWPDRVGSFEFTRMTRHPVTYGRCRLYRWEPGLHFKHRHYDLYDKNEALVASLEDAPDFQVIGLGNHYEQVPRPKAKADYYRRLREREGHPSERRGVVASSSQK